ncbi:MAG: hypothetical protein VYA07_02680 [Candidatus Thermoplasmatota archaeon]|nr:hypothetical protein [Candidatus Thermoplasmatota archaeon]
MDEAHSSNGKLVKFQGGIVEQFSSERIRDSEKLASSILESRLCVILGGPLGLFFLVFGSYMLVTEVLIKILLGGETQNYTHNWLFGVIFGSILLSICYTGRMGLSLHLTENAVYIRSLSYGFFNERVFGIGGGSLQVFAVENYFSGVKRETITLFFTPSGGEAIRIESGLNEENSGAMMKRIEAVTAKRK